MPCSFNFEQKDRSPLFYTVIFINRGHKKNPKKNQQCFSRSLSVTVFLWAKQSVSSCPPVSWVCFLSALFMWHGCDYLLPALPWPAHVLIITPSKCCSVLTLALHSVSIALLSTGAVSFIGQVLGSATCFVFLRAVSPITDSGLCWHVPVILDELRCGSVSSGT